MAEKDQRKRGKRPEDAGADRSKGQYGGVPGRLGYGAGRDIKEAERPAKPAPKRRERDRKP